MWPRDGKQQSASEGERIGLLGRRWAACAPRNAFWEPSYFLLFRTAPEFLRNVSVGRPSYPPHGEALICGARVLTRESSSESLLTLVKSPSKYSEDSDDHVRLAADNVAKVPKCGAINFPQMDCEA